MADLIITGAIAERLRQIAKQENMTIDEVLEMLIDRYLAHQAQEDYESKDDKKS